MFSKRVRVVIVAAAALAAMAVGVQPSQAAGRRYLDPVFDVTITENITYGSAVHYVDGAIDLLLDLYEPAGDDTALRPAFIFAHGGALKVGDKSWGRSYAEALARRGFVTASINYRLLDEFIDGPSFVGALHPRILEGLHDAQHDMQAAIRWFRAHAEELRINPDLIVIGGHSAGAGVALLANYRSDDPGTSGNPGYSSRPAGALADAGSILEPWHIGIGEPPLLMIHALDDTTVPYATAYTACGPAIVMGNVCDFTTFLTGGHSQNGHDEAQIAGTVDFICRRVMDCTKESPTPVTTPGTATELLDALLGPIT